MRPCHVLRHANQVQQYGGKTLGTFNLIGASEMKAWAAAGGNAVVIPVVWAAAQPKGGGRVSLASAGNAGQNVLTEIHEAVAAHLKVYLELSIQYAPQWVLNSVPAFVNQAGTSYSSSVPGADVRDWVWSQSGRNAVASFVAGAMSALRPVMSDIAGIRAGGGMFGELQYPYDGSSVNGQPSYWGYGSAPQHGVDLATNESTCPFPGYVYGHGTAAQNTEWSNWFFQSLANFVAWYIETLRQNGWSGPVYVLHPSFGVRGNWRPTSAAYELQLAHGTDYAIQMDAYEHLANVWPWSTWADDREPHWASRVQSTPTKPRGVSYTTWPQHGAWPATSWGRTPAGGRSRNRRGWFEDPWPRATRDSSTSVISRCCRRTY